MATGALARLVLLFLVFAGALPALTGLLFGLVRPTSFFGWFLAFLARFILPSFLFHWVSTSMSP